MEQSQAGAAGDRPATALAQRSNRVKWVGEQVRAWRLFPEQRQGRAEKVGVVRVRVQGAGRLQRQQPQRQIEGGGPRQWQGRHDSSRLATAGAQIPLGSG